MTAAAPSARASRRAVPLKLTCPVVDETSLHATVARALKLMLLPPAMWTTLPIGHVLLTGQQAAKFARLGVSAGWPDVLVLHAGRIHGVELKRERGRLSRTRLVRTRKGGPRMIDGQVEIFPRLAAAGMTIHVCETADAVLDALAAAGVPVRRRT
jgi:hypothetical protein